VHSRIVLIGFPGSGKTTIGKKLAKMVNYEFVDLDKWFETKYHISISDFFTKYGEIPFRVSEHQLLAEVLLMENVVVSTGGGTPCFHGNMDLIVAQAVSVYIKLSPNSLHDRLIHSKKKRPLILNKSEEEILHYINEKLTEREKYYNRATYSIKGESLSMEELVALVK